MRIPRPRAICVRRDASPCGNGGYRRQNAPLLLVCGSGTSGSVVVGRGVDGLMSQNYSPEAFCAARGKESYTSSAVSLKLLTVAFQQFLPIQIQPSKIRCGCTHLKHWTRLLQSNSSKSTERNDEMNTIMAFLRFSCCSDRVRLFVPALQGCVHACDTSAMEFPRALSHLLHRSLLPLLKAVGSGGSCTVRSLYVHCLLEELGSVQTSDSVLDLRSNR